METYIVFLKNIFRTYFAKKLTVSQLSQEESLERQYCRKDV